MKDYILKIKELIEIKNMPYGKFAQKIEKNRNTITNYFAKKTKIDVDTLVKIAEVLEVPVGYFFEDEKKISSSNINSGGVQAINTGKINVQMSDYQAEISVLRSRVAELERTIRGNEALIEELRQRIIDKEDMIELLREKC